MSKRAQVSLVFTDMDLYENCIQPLKENRELSSVIIRCLTSYYYNDEVRNAIEGYSEADMAENNNNMQQAQDMINNIQASISLMGFGLDEASEILEGGIQDITDIMDGDPTKTEAYQKYTEPTTESDETEIPKIGQVNIEKFKKDKANNKLKQPEETNNLDKITSTLDMLVNAVSGLYSSLGLANNPFSSTTVDTQVNNSTVEEKVEKNDIVTNPTVSSEISDSTNIFDSSSKLDTVDVSVDTSFLESDFDSSNDFDLSSDINNLPTDEVLTEASESEDASDDIKQFVSGLEV